MASQSSLDELSQTYDHPSTPQPQGFDLPDVKDGNQSASPSTSMIVDTGPSSVLHSSSMTPPPSSQVPTTRHALSPRRSRTPDPTVLSSPPPTVTKGVKKEATLNGKFIPPSQKQLERATSAELRDLLETVLAENSRLDIAAREARMSAAHYKLQHNLLAIDSEEAIKRMEVEHDLTRREVQVLQHQGRPSEGYSYTAKLRAYCEALQKEKELAQSRLHKAKKVIRNAQYELQNEREESARLRDRIRQNREHINILRSPGGPLHIGTPKTSPSTPQYYRGTPKQTPTSIRSVRHQPPGSARPFEALLLADAVLSQENNSAPSTPIISRRHDPRTPNRHHRSVQSLSSLPNTPGRSDARPGSGTSVLLPSVRFSPEPDSRMTNTQGWGAISASRERRRKSRDSTISAEDAHAIGARSGRSFRDESEEIQESQASQSATEMLRVDPRESFEVAASRTTTPTPGEKFTLQQAKIFGTVTKAAEKRKLVEDELSRQSAAKKLKAVAGEAIGLGIGLDASSM